MGGPHPTMSSLTCSVTPCKAGPGCSTACLDSIIMQVMRLGDLAAQAQQHPMAASAAAGPAEIAEGDLTCEVNRFDMLQRGKQS